MESITLLKIGGSVITDKHTPYTAQIDVIRTIAREVKKTPKKLLISHGSGSFGHTSASLYGGGKGYTDKWGIAKVAFDAREINHILMDIFIQEKLPAISLSPMSFLITKSGQVKQHVYEIIAAVLQQGLLPVVYGDVIWDTQWKSTIYSGEKILNNIATYLTMHGYFVEKIIQVCNTNGVYDSNKKTIPFIEPKSWNEVKKLIKLSDVPDVTGGMLHKVEDAVRMADKGIETWIINGNDMHEIVRALAGEPIHGTVIL